MTLGVAAHGDIDFDALRHHRAIILEVGQRFGLLDRYEEAYRVEVTAC